jgi:hypothetical protein
MVLLAYLPYRLQGTRWVSPSHQSLISMPPTRARCERRRIYLPKPFGKQLKCSDRASTAPRRSRSGAPSAPLGRLRNPCFGTHPNFPNSSPRTPVHKGLSSLVCRLTPELAGPSHHDDSPSYGYKLAYSIPCANPCLHTPVHVSTHVAPKARVLPPLQVRVPHNQG